MMELDRIVISCTPEKSESALAGNDMVGNSINWLSSFCLGSSWAAARERGHAGLGRLR